MIRSISGATAHVAASVSGSFQCLVDRLDAVGYRIAFMGGWRAHGSVPGSKRPSGRALDINQVARNVVTARFPAGVNAMASGCGLFHGALWSYADTGHFEVPGR